MSEVTKKNIKLFVATPAFGHMVTTNYMNSMMKFISTTHPRLNISTAMHLQSGMALVTQARNNCVSYFLNSDCTHMLFIDADIGFEPDAIHNLRILSILLFLFSKNKTFYKIEFVIVYLLCTLLPYSYPSHCLMHLHNY